MRIHPTELNNIQVLRLKDKLGTKALPTAELQLNGSHALLVGEPGHGIKIVTKMLNMTRLYNSVCSIAQMRRAYQLALDYSDRRLAFGKKIAEQPLHRHTLRLAKIAIDKAVILTFRMALLLGKEECHQADPTEQFLLRLLTPVTKLLTARRSIDICTEMLEAIGGAAYVEDTEFPALLRDAHVFPIWEGTTNVLSLDVLRVIEKSEHGLLLYFNELKQSITKFGDETLRGRLLLKLDEFEKSCQALLAADAETIQTQARSLSYALGEWFSTIEMLKLSESTPFIDGLPSII
jgi:putative acyl-CoA dehydrogenase